MLLLLGPICTMILFVRELDLRIIVVKPLTVASYLNAASRVNLVALLSCVTSPVVIRPDVDMVTVLPQLVVSVALLLLIYLPFVIVQVYVINTYVVTDVCIVCAT